MWMISTMTTFEPVPLNEGERWVSGLGYSGRQHSVHTVLIPLHLGLIFAQLWISIPKWRLVNAPNECTQIACNMARFTLQNSFCTSHLRDLSRSLAACAALSSPVGSKLLHLSLSLSPPPPDPPAGAGGGGGCGPGGGASGCPLLRPNSQDILLTIDFTRLMQAGQKNEALTIACQLTSSTCVSRWNPSRNCRRRFAVVWTTAFAIGYWQSIGFFIGSCNSVLHRGRVCQRMFLPQLYGSRK